MSRRSTFRTAEEPLARRIDKLELELYVARRTLINRLSLGIQELLVHIPRSLTFGEAYDWFEEAMLDVVDMAELIPESERTDTTYNGDRARCPLCGDSANDYYNPNNGFAFPEGLRRHLMGANNTNQCEVSREILAHVRYVSALPDPGEWRSNMDI